MRGGTGPSSWRLFRKLNKLAGADMDKEDGPVERTTIIEPDDGGNGGIVAVVVLFIVVLVLLFVFRQQLGFGSRSSTVNVPDKINVNVS